MKGLKSLPRLYILVFILILIGLVVVMRASSTKTAKALPEVKAKQVMVHKINRTAPAQKTESFWLFLSIVLLMAGEAVIIFILFKKGNGKTVAEMNLENQKMAFQKEELSRRIEAQKDEKVRLENEIQEKERFVQSVIENDKLLNTNYTRIKSEVDSLRTERDSLAKQLQEKAKELQVCRNQLESRVPARRERLTHSRNKKGRD